MADATVPTDNEHSPIQLMASSSAVVIPVASVPEIIKTILDDDRFKKELASLVDKQIARNCKDIPVTTLTVAAKPQDVHKSKRQKLDKIPKAKTCIFKGCMVTDNNTKFVQASCPAHYEIVKARNNKQRVRHNYKKKLENNYDLNVGNIATNSKFVKYISYYDEVLMNTSVTKGVLIGLTRSATNTYASLKKNGFAFLPHAVSIADDDYSSLISTIEGKGEDDAWTFNKLFTGLKRDNSAEIIKSGSPNRWETHNADYGRHLRGWNDLEVQLNDVMVEGHFPNLTKKSRGVKQKPREFHYDFSILKSDPYLMQSQAAHTDADPEFTLGRNKNFGFVVIVGIEKRGFLDLKTEAVTTHPRRVLIERGDLFCMRTDIPHAGCENLTDKTHYRIHAFCESEPTSDSTDVVKVSTMASSQPFAKGPYFDEVKGVYCPGLREL